MSRLHNDLAFSCEALLRPPPIQVFRVSGGGRSVQGLGSCKAGLGAPRKRLQFNHCEWGIRICAPPTYDEVDAVMSMVPIS